MDREPVYWWVRKTKGRRLHHAVATIPPKSGSAHTLMGAVCGWYAKPDSVLVRRPEDVPRNEPICTACLRDINLNSGYAQWLKGTKG